MYRKDILLETTDLRLRLFVEYCKLLQPLYEDNLYFRKRLDTYGLVRVNGSVIRSSRFKKEYTNDILLDLIDKEEATWKKYKDIHNQVDQIVLVIKKLNGYELNLLYLRYERRLTFRQIGDIIGYSYMQVSRILDEVLIKFE